VATVRGRAFDLLRYASDEGHPPAQFDYGLALVNGQSGDGMRERGAHLIVMASREGDADALAWCGNAALSGLHDEPVDYDRAFELLTRAAAEDHPFALSLLARMHREGLGRPAEPTRAFELTLRAAEAGYAFAQYEVAMALSDGAGVPRDDATALTWLRQASEAGQPHACLALARVVRRDTVQGADDEVLRLLLLAAEHLNEARFELANLNMQHHDPSSWVQAAVLVQATYETAVTDGDDALAERCRASAPVWLSTIEGRIRSNAGRAVPDKVITDYVCARFMFDDYGRPYPCRAERNAMFIARLEKHRQALADGQTGDRERLIRQLAGNLSPGGAAAPLRRAPARLEPVAQRTLGQKIGRNDPCSCRSGRKFKVCCGRGAT